MIRFLFFFFFTRREASWARPFEEYAKSGLMNVNDVAVKRWPTASVELYHFLF